MWRSIAMVMVLALSAAGCRHSQVKQEVQPDTNKVTTEEGKDPGATTLTPKAEEAQPKGDEEKGKTEEAQPKGDEESKAGEAKPESSSASDPGAQGAASEQP